MLGFEFKEGHMNPRYLKPPALQCPQPILLSLSCRCVGSMRRILKHPTLVPILEHMWLCLWMLRGAIIPPSSRARNQSRVPDVEQLVN